MERTQQPKQDDKPLNGVSVLLVEDNIANQKVALAMLRLLGAETLIASSGEQAVQLFPNSGVDVILMDCQMPNMDGYETTAAIREFERQSGIPPTPIIALTANAMQEDRQFCLNAGMTDYLMKPIEYELLGKTILDNISGQTQCVTEEESDSGSITVSSQLNKMPSGLDAEALLQLKKVCEDQSLYDQVISIYLVESKRLMADLENFYQEGDCTALAKAAHGLKTSSRNVAARALAQLLMDLELQAKRNCLEGIGEIYAAISEEYKLVSRLLEEQL